MHFPSRHRLPPSRFLFRTKSLNRQPYIRASIHAGCYLVELRFLGWVVVLIVEAGVVGPKRYLTHYEMPIFALGGNDMFLP